MKSVEQELDSVGRGDVRPFCRRGFTLVAVAAIMVLAAPIDAPALAEPGYIIGICASFVGLLFLM
jgi:hypothetical protein